MKRWIVRLGDKERRRLQEVLSRGSAPAHTVRHAWVLLAVDESLSGQRQTDAEAAQAVGITVRSVEMLRRRFVEHGLEACLVHKNQTQDPDDAKCKIARC